MADKQTKRPDIDLTSLVETHDSPFVVIDKNYHILAANKAYAEVYGTQRHEVVGRTCFNVSHGNDKPCDLEGEECPHKHLFATGEAHSCLHIHYDAEKRMHQVRVTAHPLQSPDGTMYMGETIEELSTQTDCDNVEDRMVGQSLPFLTCMEQLSLAAASDSTVLLQGETGTGKELAAKYIHDHSTRKTAPFMVVDCTVLNESLFEAEVFGVADDAANNNEAEKAGVFAQAEGGTICLDEIGGLPEPLQARLLRVLETGQYRQVGGHKTLSSNVRIICTTNCHLWESVLAGQFREDLYYRVACLNIRLPNLRERLDDIPLLAENLLECASKAMQRSFHLTRNAIHQLKNYYYSGNVRELRNILDIAVTHCSNGAVNEEHIQKAIFQLSQAREQFHKDTHNMSYKATQATVSCSDGGAPATSDNTSLRMIEKHHINRLLNRFGGNRREVAGALGVSERTLYRKLKRYALS